MKTRGLDLYDRMFGQTEPAMDSSAEHSHWWLAKPHREEHWSIADEKGERGGPQIRSDFLTVHHSPGVPVLKLGHVTKTVVKLGHVTKTVVKLVSFIQGGE